MSASSTGELYSSRLEQGISGFYYWEDMFVCYANRGTVIPPYAMYIVCLFFVFCLPLLQIFESGRFTYTV